MRLPIKSEVRKQAAADRWLCRDKPQVTVQLVSIVSYQNAFRGRRYCLLPLPHAAFADRSTSIAANCRVTTSNLILIMFHSSNISMFETTASLVSSRVNLIRLQLQCRPASESYLKNDGYFDWTHWQASLAEWNDRFAVRMTVILSFAVGIDPFGIQLHRRTRVYSRCYFCRRPLTGAKILIDPMNFGQSHFNAHCQCHWHFFLLSFDQLAITRDI